MVPYCENDTYVQVVYKVTKETTVEYEIISWCVYFTSMKQMNLYF